MDLHFYYIQLSMSVLLNNVILKKKNKKNTTGLLKVHEISCMIQTGIAQNHGHISGKQQPL